MQNEKINLFCRNRKHKNTDVLNKYTDTFFLFQTICYTIDWFKKFKKNRNCGLIRALFIPPPFLLSIPKSDGFLTFWQSTCSMQNTFKIYLYISNIHIIWLRSFGPIQRTPASDSQMGGYSNQQCICFVTHWWWVPHNFRLMHYGRVLHRDRQLIQTKVMTKCNHATRDIEIDLVWYE